MKMVLIVIAGIIAYILVGYIVGACGAAIEEEKMDEGYIGIVLWWPAVLVILIIYAVWNFFLLPIAKKLSIIPVAIVKTMQVMCENYKRKEHD